jgi:hypothetical protein
MGTRSVRCPPLTGPEDNDTAWAKKHCHAGVTVLSSLRRRELVRATAVRTAQSASAALGCPASSLTFAPKVRKNRFRSGRGSRRVATACKRPGDGSQEPAGENVGIRTADKRSDFQRLSNSCDGAAGTRNCSRLLTNAARRGRSATAAAAFRELCIQGLLNRRSGVRRAPPRWGNRLSHLQVFAISNQRT